MAFSFSDEYPVLGNNTKVDDPVSSPLGDPKVIGTWVESFAQGSATVPASGAIFIASYPVIVSGFKLRLGTNGGAGAAVMLEKTPNGTAVGSGTSLLTGTVALTGQTANTNISGTLVASLTSLSLAAGDSLSLVFSGTLTALAGLVIAIQVQKI